MIWNRACGEDPLRTLPGDRALADLLYAHGLAMNGGDELRDAQVGYRYYGFDAVASLLSRAMTLLDKGDYLEDQESELDGEYLALIPSDSSLVARFEKQLASSPSDFAPPRAMDLG